MAKAKRQWEYRVTSPMLPQDAKSPVMDSRQIERWLNQMDEEGWEFVGYGAKHWNAPQMIQEWWIFRRTAK